MSSYIYHNGIVDRIEGDTVFVKVLQRAACTECQVKDLCLSSESKEKIIEVKDNTNLYSVGEEVTLCGQTSLGLQAVVYAFVVPLVLMIGSVIVGFIMDWHEAICALLAVGLLAVYYFILYLLQSKLKKKFIFTLKKLNR